MSITSERIREQPFFHALADDAAEEIETLEKELDQFRGENERLKAELAKAKNDAERYQFLRTEWFREDDQNSWYMDTDTMFFESPDDMDMSIDDHLEDMKGK